MNLAEIRTRIFNQIDWAPTTSAEAVTRTNGFINRAYEQLCLEAPFCFFESEVKLSTQKDVKSNDDVTGFGFIPGTTQLDRLVNADDALGSGLWSGPTIRLQSESVGVGTVPIGPTTTQNENESIQTWRGNPWVFYWNLNGTDANWQDFVDQGGVIPPIDGSWDGRNIDIQMADGKWHQNRIRGIWVNDRSAPGVSYMYFIALWKPFPIEQLGSDVISTLFKYRVYTEEYYFPDDMIKAHSIVINDDQRTYPVDIILQEEAEQFSLTDHFEMASGIPSVAYRRSHFQLPAPNTGPVASLHNWESATDFLWKGPEPAGVFSYLITYCIGKRDLNYRNPGPGMFDENYTNTLFQNASYATTFSPTLPNAVNPVYPNAPVSNRFREPLWESAPSPPSSKVEVVIGGEGSTAGWGVTLQVPNIAFMLGMLGRGFYADGAASLNFSRSFVDKCGVQVRIYRRRYSQNWEGYGTLGAGGSPFGAMYNSLVSGGADQAPDGHIEISDAYYLLAEMQVTHNNRGIFIDDGQMHPDYNRRLRDVHGYQSMGLYPVPSRKYEFKVRCLRRPPKLVDDQDVPLVHAEACNALIDLAAAYWYEAEGVPEMAQRMRERYDRGIFDLKKRYGNLQSQANPHLKRLSRAKAGFRRTRPLRKWWTLP
ncbi:MAG TPA: hypothetical protein EYN27_08360 [Rhodospirillales bacterium]|nr:hypothetical protein [Rhodospirillales bacterium]